MIDDALIEKYAKTIKEMGYSEEQLVDFLMNSAETAGVLTGILARVELTDEDLQEIEDIQGDIEAEAKIEELFYVRTGKHVVDYMEEIRKELLEHFLAAVDEAKKAEAEGKLDELVAKAEADDQE